jgi:single-strand DNA-binding protein
MSGSVNKVILVGNLGADPEVRSLGDGAEVANLRIATSERWKDRTSGEQKERTEWHRVSIFGDGLVNVAKNYLRKGSKIYLEGSLQTRQYEKDGQTQYATEIVLRGFDAKLVMLDGRNEGGESGGERGGNSGGQRSSGGNQGGGRQPAPAFADDSGLDDVPF